MARIAAKITLTEKQAKILPVLSNGRTVSRHYQQRATIVLHCAQGKTNSEIMETLDVHKKTLSKWRTRWVKTQDKLLAIEKEEQGIAYRRAIEQILNDTPRSGTPPKFSAEQICLIMSLACESPQEHDLAFSHWRLSSLADELARRGIVESISTSQLPVFLKSGQYQAPQSGAVASYAH